MILRQLFVLALAVAALAILLRRNPGNSPGAIRRRYRLFADEDDDDDDD